jgi:hypothetical protein
MRVKPLVVVIAMVLLGTFVVRAQDAAKPRAIRLVKPWSQMTSLTDEQKGKIADIHAKANAAKKEIEAKERADILSLLSDEQKAEAKKVEETDRAAAKERSAEAKQEQ